MGVDYIIKRLNVGFANNCTYIVANLTENTAVLIDPAWELEKILDCLEVYKVAVSAILLTHSHQDHTNLVSALVDKFNCKVYMSSKEIEFYGFRTKNLLPVDDLNTVKIGGLCFKCFLTPGHTVGSMCFKIGNNLFTGDTIFIRSCGFCNCKGSDIDALFDSIKKIKKIVHNNSNIYPGHYFRDDLKYERDYLTRNLYFHINDRKIFRKFVDLNDKKNIYINYEC